MLRMFGKSFEFHGRQFRRISQEFSHIVGPLSFVKCGMALSSVFFGLSEDR